MRWHGRRVAVYAYTQPVDMRKGFDGLSALITGRLPRDPLTGDEYIFVAVIVSARRCSMGMGRAAASVRSASSAGDWRGSGRTRPARRL